MSKDEEEPYALLDERHLFNLALQIKERWQELANEGLICSEGDNKPHSMKDARCLNKEEIEACQNYAPNDEHLQAYQMLVTWRYRCWQNNCTKRGMLTTLLNGLRSCGNELAANYLSSEMNIIYSLEYV